MSDDMALDTCFLDRYLTYQELTRVVKHWADRYPDFIRLRSLAQSSGRREVWMLEVGRAPDRLRPAVWIDGNMHAAELLGTNVALRIAHALIQLHSGAPGRADALSPAVRDAALRALYYIVPRISPDGAEEVLTARRISRSAPRTRATNRPAYWVRSDVDGDGKVLQMRIRHPAGEFVTHPDYPDVLVARHLEDAGPFFKVFPEGYIEGFDGSTIPVAHTLSDNAADFNRNFPFEWSGEGDGAGEFPGSEPETRAIIDFATSAPHVFAWLNLHTFGGVFIRPPFSSAEDELNREDLAVYEELAERAHQHTGMRTISAFADMTPVPSRPMTGTLAAWAYGERGCFAWAIELWDIFAATGVAVETPFFRSYSLKERSGVGRLVKWDKEKNQGRVFGGWRSFPHPQLGNVEIGGLDPVFGLWNPPEKEIARISDGLVGFAMTVAAFAPVLQMEVSTKRIGPRMTEVLLLVRNVGYLPSHVTAGTATREWNSGPRVVFSLRGCTLVSGPRALDLNHLRGWGRGAYEEADGIFFQKSQTVRDIGVAWLVQGDGSIDLEVGCPRVGWERQTITVSR